MNIEPDNYELYFDTALEFEVDKDEALKDFMQRQPELPLPPPPLGR